MQVVRNADMHMYAKCDKNIPCGSRVMNICTYVVVLVTRGQTDGLRTNGFT